VDSLAIETKSYNEVLVAPKVLSSWQRFRGRDFNKDQGQQEHEFAYKEGQRYLRMFNTTGDPATGTRRVTYNSERGSDGMRVW
jgi:hypothetical protein